ncbi:hypothetical protein HPP92_005730 [Vanilla planifolia]|uniref:Uncharacterized protein n=1 Tax=Vanilla planifolia TaxID=51239 RepID=A0A835RM87_VANPL|nr:hypothetical protein HPP92_005730 [Vanilla planifolia]
MLDLEGGEMRWKRVPGVATEREMPEGEGSAGRTAGIGGPGKRWGHSCNSVNGGRYIYVFGGYAGDACQTNDVHVLDAVKQIWSKPMMKGEPPSPRDSHSCTTVGRRLFVFGGTDGMNILNDLHILDTSSNRWISPILHGKGPDAREGHSAAAVDKRLFIFGGCGKSDDSHEDTYYNDLYILDTETLVWQCAVTSGSPPIPRDSHTCSSCKSNIIVLGGEDASDCYLSDVHMLDAETLTWRQITTSGQMLTPRAGHTTVSLGSNLFVFGGFTDARNLYDDLYVLNIETGIWSKVANINNGPSARFSGAGDCLDEQRGILVFFGGCDKSLVALDDMYYLYTDMTVYNDLSQPEQDVWLGKGLKRRYIDYSQQEKCSGLLPTSLTSSLCQPGYLLSEYGQGSKVGGSCCDREIAFEARVTSTNRYGCAIETIVNGKYLRGMLFSGTSRCAEDVEARMKKKIGDADSKENLGFQVLSCTRFIPQVRKPVVEDTDVAQRREEAVQGLLDAPDLNSPNTAKHENMTAEKLEPTSERNAATKKTCDPAQVTIS